ncbi:phytanoyl-CoA hydroxylase [Reichenbachiella agariperforans]|uniref:Phytanoyl-CoA hydroxylase n=1 Tax=Reichenbachiella agariperforans TaxID=156994 RepID=A0A1M6NUQ9_REIAG|nr:phytanoyl-CoA dioxygenase family protein [Reichenbachiella agariperforans]SHJ99425.1 phytanoyl-CoA hydroxylase [Reichenbachiella agariperforans]
MNLKEKFNNDGFVILKNVVSTDLIEQAKDLTEDIIDYFDHTDTDPFDQFFMNHRVDQGTLYDLYFRHPEFQQLATHKGVIGALREIVGEDFFLYENSLVYKPKGKKNAVPWHQDFMNRTDEPSKFIIWVALDDVTIANGALKFIPGSHKNGFLPYFQVKGETHHTRLKLDGVDLDNYIHGEMEAGDVLIFHHLVIHSSDLVDVDEPRRAYRFSVQGFKQLFSPRCVPVVLSGGRPKAYKNASPRIINKSLLKKFINKVGNRLSNI